MGSIFCSNCGTAVEKIPGKSKVFCSNCGMRIDLFPDTLNQTEASTQDSVDPLDFVSENSSSSEGDKDIFDELFQNESESAGNPQPTPQPVYAAYNEPQSPPQQSYPPYNDYQSAAPQQPYQQYGAAQQTYQQSYQQPYNQGYSSAPQQPKKSKKPIIVAAVVIGLVLIIALYNLVFKPIYITSISFDTGDINSDKNSIVLDVGESYELEYTLTPYNNRHDDLAWSSTDTAVAIVDDGVITAIGQGNCTISAISEKGISSKINITVEKVAEKISLSRTSIEVNEGETAVISVSFNPQDTTDKHCTWESDDTSVATVNDGIVKGVSEGTCTITVTSVYGPVATCTITVKKPTPESILVGTWNGYYAEDSSSKYDFDSGDAVFIINSDGTAVHYLGEHTFNFTWKYIKTDEDGDFVFYFYYADGSRAAVYYLNSGRYAGQIQLSDDGVHVWYKKAAIATA